MNKPQMNAFQFAKLTVWDLDKTAAYYRDVCGLSELMRVEEKIADRAITEVLFKSTGDSPFPFAPFILVKIHDRPRSSNDAVVLVYATDDLAAFLKRARAAGGTVVEDIRAVPEHGSKIAFVRDVEGHLMEVVEPMTR